MYRKWCFEFENKTSCFVWDKIFYHTSLMKMWHFYLLEKRDVLLQDCYENESRSYFERTFSFQFEWDHVLTKMDNFLWKFFYYWFLKKMRSFWLETWLYLGPNKNDILVCCFRHDKNQIKIVLPCRKFFPVTTSWLKR